MKYLNKAILAVFMICAMALTIDTYAQTTYWMGRKANDGKIYFDVQVPGYFKTWLEQKSPTSTAKTINGNSYDFHSLDLAWDNRTSNAYPNNPSAPGSSPQNTGQIRINNDWKNQDKNQWGSFRDALYALGTNDPNGWSDYPGTEFVKTSNPTAPGLTITLDPTMSNIQKQLDLLLVEKALTKTAVQYFSHANIKMPQNMGTVRNIMLEISNLARRDPEYRKNYAKDTNNAGRVYATDFTGPSVQTHTTEDLYKSNQTAPYFDDLALDSKLNDAAQYHAEWMAKHKDLGHEQNSDNTYNGKSMQHHWERATVLGFTGNTSGEACSMDLDPQCWMSGNTHFRPFFNVGSKVSKIGFGAAQSTNGDWYVCALFDKVN